MLLSQQRQRIHEVFHGNEKFLLNAENLGKASTEDKNTMEYELVMDAFLVHSKQRYPTTGPPFTMVPDKNTDPGFPSTLKTTQCNNLGTPS